MYDELGLVLCEWNRLPEAMQYLRQGSALGEKGFDTGVLGWSYLTMIRALFTQGDSGGTQEIIRKMDKLEQESDVPPWYASPKEAWRARVLLAQGDLEAATRWAQDRGLTVESEVSYPREEEQIAFARILLGQGRITEAQYPLERLIEQAEHGGRIESIAQCLLISALALRMQSDIGKPLTHCPKPSPLPSGGLHSDLRGRGRRNGAAASERVRPRHSACLRQRVAGGI